MTRREQIISKAIEIIKNRPTGIRYSELKRKLQETFPDFPHGTIVGSLRYLSLKKLDEIYKPTRGLFKHLSFKEIGEPLEVKKVKLLEEKDFYKPFADWLINEIEECTKAIPLGGNAFKDKWGTPDVIGIRESKRGDIIQLPTEIISAEIKIDTRDLIAAFGQAENKGNSRVFCPAL